MNWYEKRRLGEYIINPDTYDWGGYNSGTLYAAVKTH